MMKSFIISILLLISINVFSSPLDSVGYEARNGKHFILHKITDGETLFGIARKYGVNPKEIISENPGIEKKLPVGKTIPVPVKVKMQTTSANSSILNEVVNNQDYSNSKIVINHKIHTVLKGQTLYSIAKQYNTSVDDIVSWNHLPAKEIKLNQSLIVSKSTNDHSENNGKVQATSKVNKMENGLDKITEGGFAEVFDTPNGAQFYFALHRTAPLGTKIRVKNSINDQSIFVRVTGQMPAGVKDNVVILLSKIAFERLAASQNEIKVEISYVP